MKICLIFLFAFSFQIMAIDTHAQDAVIQLNTNNTTFGQLINEIERQTDFLVIYSNREVDINKKIYFQNKLDKVSAYLNAALTNSDIGYEFENNYIVLAKRVKNNSSKNANFIQVAQQQGITLTGTIKDTNELPIIGATIINTENPSQGTVSDYDGNFTLSGLDENTVLRISYVGMIDLEVALNGKTYLDITMEVDSELLDEIVVVGYGVQKKRDLTGAISSVKLDDTPINTISTISHALGGKAAGLRVVQNSAQVGGGTKFRIRGEASTGAGNDPLIIIDGFPINSNVETIGSGNRYNEGNLDNILESLNPNDIESIDILKDASSTAIYGSRAGHGVIIITTKRGKQQKAQVSYSGNVSVQNMSRRYDILNSQDYMKQRNRYSKELWMKENAQGIYKDYITLSPGHIVRPFVPRHSDEDIANAEYTDWMDEVTRLGYLHQHNTSMRGGTENTQYIASVGLMEQQGVVKTNNMKRFTAKFNLDQDINDFVKAGFSLNISRNEYRNVPLGASEWESSGIITSAARYAPILSIRDEKGEYIINPEKSQVPNPVSLLEITDKMLTDRLIGLAYVSVEPIEGLVFRASLGTDRRTQKRNNYLPKTTLYGKSVNGQAFIGQQDNMDYLMDLTANYTKTQGNHSFTGLMGYSYQSFETTGLSGSNQNFLTDAFLYHNLGAGSYPRPSVGSSGEVRSLGSYFGRVNYSLMDKYLLTATLRTDGASNFDPENRWGYFPSISAAWRFNEEDFLNSVAHFLSNGKIRIGYGETGNSNIGNKTKSYYSQGYGSVFGDSGYEGVVMSVLGNPLLTWETTKEFNVGFDLGFFNNRLSIVADFFNRKITDLLVSEKYIPTHNEIDKLASNIGTTQSRGFEFTINSINILKKNFTWTSDIVLSKYNDRWLERDPNWAPAAYQSEQDPIRSSYNYISEGLLNVGETAPAHQKSLLPGQVKLKDLNNDGKLNDEDKIFMGNNDPSLIFGLTNSLNYKNFDLNFHMYGEANRIQGGSYYDVWAMEGRYLIEGSNVSYGFTENWTHDNHSAIYPNPLPSDFGYGNYFMKKVHFIRMRNITLGYTIPVNPKNLSRVRVYFDVNNPFVITNWKGLDPETDGHQYAYPNVISYNLGVDITF